MAGRADTLTVDYGWRCAPLECEIRGIVLSVGEKPKMSAESGTTRWWENYLVRYLMPSIAGVPKGDGSGPCCPRRLENHKPSPCPAQAR
jgi:hypothetical protein